MEIERYVGYSPKVVKKDAKYSVNLRGQVTLEYRESQRVRTMLETEHHPELVRMVNRIKVLRTRSEGGSFYINEFRDVLVPDGEGGPCFWAGRYEGTLEFFSGDMRVSAKGSTFVLPGEEWTGPHVGIPYVLTAGATDVKYEMADGRRREIVLLSDYHAPSKVAQLTRRLALHKGVAGGRIFLNEEREFFTHVEDEYGASKCVYLGHLENDGWFPAPSV